MQPFRLVGWGGLALGWANDITAKAPESEAALRRMRLRGTWMRSRPPYMRWRVRFEDRGYEWARVPFSWLVL